MQAELDHKRSYKLYRNNVKPLFSGRYIKPSPWRWHPIRRRKWKFRKGSLRLERLRTWGNYWCHLGSTSTTKYTPPWLRPSRVGSCGAPHQPNQSLLRKLCQSLQKRTFAPNFGFPWGSMISSIRWRSRGCSIGSLRGKNAVNWCSTTGQQMPKQPGLPDKQPHKACYPWRTTRGTAFDLCHRLWNKSTGDCGLRMHQTAVKGNF